VQAAILAGGLGTRLRPVTKATPKAMVLVDGRPFLEYEVALLKSEGIRDFVMCVGYLGDAIVGHFGDGSSFGVSIAYSRDGPRLLGPAGALRRAEPLLGDAFFVTYGDAYLRAPYSAMMGELLKSGRLGLMAVYKNENRHGTSDIAIRGGKVVRYDKKGGEGLTWVNYGVTALRKSALAAIPEASVVGEEEFYGSLIAKGELLARPVARRFYEVGTPASLEDFKRFVARGGSVI
jgi:NDP-sugar pyrophosphorylase family protein